MKKFDRRTLLTATGSSLAALLAGCQSGGSGAGTGTQSTTETRTTPSPTDRTERTTTESETTQDPEALTRRTREFVTLIDEGSYEQAHERFNPTAGEEIGPDRLERVWTSLEDQLGDFQALSGAETSTWSGYDVVTATLNFEDGRREAVVTFGEEGIAGFRIRPAESSWSAPAYADESAFTEREVALPATDTCSLSGTLSVPRNADRTPGVVLVHGSGAHDRDETIGPNKVFKDLAWGLASQGVTVLRYEKRNYACDVDLAEVTIDEVVTDDALTAVETLRETPTVEASDVVVVGHSLGGTMAPPIAAQDGNLAGVVLLAAMARPATEAILDQNRYLAERDGTVTDAEERQLEQVRDIVERIRSLDFPDDEVVHLGGDEYWETLREYDHVETAASLDLPRLVLQGERDYQVTIEEDFRQWQQAMDDQSNVTFERYPRLNHLFMPGSGKPSHREYFEENHVAEQVGDDIATFALNATGIESGTDE